MGVSEADGMIIIRNSSKITPPLLFCRISPPISLPAGRSQVQAAAVCVWRFSLLVTQVRKARSTQLLLSLVTFPLNQKSDLTELNWRNQNLNAHWIYSGERQHCKWTTVVFLCVFFSAKISILL